MQEKEIGLAAQVSAILQKDARQMNWLDIIVGLVEVIDTQETMMALFLMDKGAEK